MFLLDTSFISYSVIIDKIGFNPAINQSLITVADILGVLLSSIFIRGVKRQGSGLIIFGMCTLLSLCSYVLYIPSDCDDCWRIYLQMGIVMLVRIGI